MEGGLLAFRTYDGLIVIFRAKWSYRPVSYNKPKQLGLDVAKFTVAFKSKILQKLHSTDKLNARNRPYMVTPLLL